MSASSRRRIAHLTSVHPRLDTRIFVKECRSLAAAGHEIFLVVADGLGDAQREGVYILDAGRSQGRLDRMLHASRRVIGQARALEADVYHLHDPELLPFALSLKRRGARVIFDAHEDLPLQILSKPYLAPRLRRPIAATAGALEYFICKRLDAVIAATPSIRDSFSARGIPAIDVNNYPLLHELETAADWGGKKNEVCYVGGIAAIRGVKEVVAALPLCRERVRLNLGGRFSDATLQAAVELMSGWENVNALGFLSRSQIRDVFGRSIAGLVTLHPTAAYIESLPVKMFEYMSAGLPVIASDFPLWREIVDTHACGICVDPLNPASIADAIDTLASNPDAAKRMGQSGRQAVVRIFNWDAENLKLQALYNRLLPSS